LLKNLSFTFSCLFPFPQKIFSKEKTEKKKVQNCGKVERTERYKSLQGDEALAEALCARRKRNDRYSRPFYPFRMKSNLHLIYINSETMNESKPTKLKGALVGLFSEGTFVYTVKVSFLHGKH